ncbi:hypothetical protein FB45DRAFT_907951 [Roridomyces roridus]|uniref:Uncharacterized protein n=1 Tax=Roridomyces roridus TaxID=1738132 RepID=A0AAD7C287_9AGAR|nr:hypothetical protein FB45DRAFT_907951 [Roridomyces roridus]
MLFPLIWAWLLLVYFVAAETIHGSQDIVCTPFGPCEQCPADLLSEPFCQPFGTRRIMHCINTTSSAIDPPPIQAPHTQAWAACGRVVTQERGDFLEFVGCNLLFAAVALFGVYSRSRRMRALQARQLAARISQIR